MVWPTMPTKTVKCSKCAGSGKAILSPVLYRTLNAITGLGRPTIPELRRYLAEKSLHPTAINRRVKKLTALKLVHRINKRNAETRYRVV